MSKIQKFLLAISLWVVTSAAAADGILCQGQLWMPTMANWNNAFPITTAGVPSPSMYNNPMLMWMPPVCFCKIIPPGIPFPGIGITYWEPLYVAEVTNMPGCLSFLGGIPVLPRPMVTPSESTGDLGNANKKSNKGGSNLRNMQVHWVEYPLFAVMDVFLGSACQSGVAGFAVGEMTEILPNWQDEEMANIMFPLALLVASVPAQLSCIPDVATSTFRNPLEPLFWCVGSQGLMYPLSGWSGILDNGTADTNVLILAKFMQMNATVGLLLQSIGSSAMCFSHYNPYLVRGQFRLEPIQPVPSMMTITLGQPTSMWQSSPPLNPTNRIDNNFLIWQGRQCCLL